MNHPGEDGELSSFSNAPLWPLQSCLLSAIRLFLGADGHAEALRSHGAICEVAKVENSPFGVRYILEGELATPDGRNPVVRSVWFIERGEYAPKLVTVYPVGRKRR